MGKRESEKIKKLKYVFVFNFPAYTLTTFTLFLVEAPGIEPGSGSTTSKRLHAYHAYLDFRSGNAGRKAFPNPIPLNLA